MTEVAVVVQQLADGLEQMCDRQVERLRNRLPCAQADFLTTLLKFRYVVLVNSGFLGKINLAPATLLTQLQTWVEEAKLAA
jgi:hypothetical protein